MLSMLLGLTGHAGAGKDSVGHVLAAAGWRTVALADALRIEVASTWHVDPRLLTERSSKERPTPQFCVGAGANANWLRWAAVNGLSLIEPRSPRWVLQQWGAWRRMSDPLYWVQHVQQWIWTQQHLGYRYLAVTDVRMANEADTLQRMGGHIVRVHRPGLTALPPETAGHDSERHTAIRAAADIHNDGDLPALGAEVWRVVAQLASRPADE